MPSGQEIGGGGEERVADRSLGKPTRQPGWRRGEHRNQSLAPPTRLGERVEEIPKIVAKILVAGAVGRHGQECARTLSHGVSLPALGKRSAITWRACGESTSCG
jgi:hypothetical protein